MLGGWSMVGPGASVVPEGLLGQGPPLFWRVSAGCMQSLCPHLLSQAPVQESMAWPWERHKGGLCGPSESPCPCSGPGLVNSREPWRAGSDPATGEGARVLTEPLGSKPLAG